MAAAKNFILNVEIDSEDMGLEMNIVMTNAGGIGNGLAPLGDLQKAIIEFKSINIKLDTPTLINHFKRENSRKVTAEI
jgi:hypothetical protein